MRLIRIITACQILIFGQGLLSLPAQAQTEPEVVHIPAACVEVGTLLMDYPNSPLRKICLDAFAIARYEVTFAEYDQFTEATGRATRNDMGFGRGDRPVVDVDWFDAALYAAWLSEETGKSYRLPTDAEWEYAAKLHTEFGHNYSWGVVPEPNKANCLDCGSQWDAQMSAPVGSFEPNLAGVYDMHGNVWEWTTDCFYEESPPEGETHCEIGVIRGGSWDSAADKMIFWQRAPRMTQYPAGDVGFRLVLESAP